jgi:hypothetical protein
MLAAATAASRVTGLATQVPNFNWLVTAAAPGGPRLPDLAWTDFPARVIAEGSFRLFTCSYAASSSA